MTAKKLELVKADPPPSPAPPRPLGKCGTALWRSITSEYAIDDAGGAEMLAQACAALDRAESCRAAIDKDGETIRMAAG